MSYEVLARKWRPQTFDEVIGQDQITKTLQNALRLNRLHHAYLFCGPRGTGKTTTARLLAKALNCEKGPTPEPCNHCTFCKEITTGSSLDVMEIDAASNTGVDDVRELRESARYATAAARYKIYIIDEVHRLSKSAFDALLKTLEEPPSHVFFVFATTEIQDVPPTIRSRCLRFDFRLIDLIPLRDALARIAQAESLAITDEALKLIANEAHGSLRDGQSLLDQVAAFGSEEITAETIAEALGLVSTQTLFDLSAAMGDSDAARLVNILDDISRAGRDWSQLVRQLTEHVKQLLFVRSLGDDYRSAGLTAEELQHLRDAAESFDETDLMRLVIGLSGLSSKLKRSVNPMLDCEIFFLQQAISDRAVDLRRLVDRLEKSSSPAEPVSQAGLFGNNKPAQPQSHWEKPKSQAGTGQSMPAQRSTSARSYSPKPPEQSPTSPRADSGASRSTNSDSAGSAVAVAEEEATAGVEAPVNPWGQIRNRLIDVKPSLQALLRDVRLEHPSQESAMLSVYGCNGHHEAVLGQREIRELIIKSCREVLGEKTRVEIRLKQETLPKNGNSAMPSATASTAHLEEKVRDNPIIKTLLERYDGQIMP